MTRGHASIFRSERLWLVLAGTLAIAWLVVAAHADTVGATQADDDDAARARRAVATRPLDQGSLRDLARIEAQAGRPEKARSFLVLSSRLGWRDTPTELMLVRDAAMRGDEAGALRHLDALLRRRPALDTRLLPLLHQAAQDPRGRAALIDALAPGPQWRGAFFADMTLLPVSAKAGHEAVLAELARRGTLSLDTELVPYVRALVGEGEVSPARALWVGLAGVPDGLVLDPGFARLKPDASPDSRSPFEWTVPRVTGATLRLLPGEGSEAAGVSIYTDQAFGTVLTQWLTLSPGGYRLNVTTTSGDVFSGGALRWTVRCQPGGRETGVARVAVSGAWRQDFVIPATGCPAQTISLEARRAAGPGTASAEVRRIDLAPTDGVQDAVSEDRP